MRARKVDENQAEIMAALRKVGASVYVIEEPVDLLVGFRRRTIAIEVKNPKRDWKLTPQQEIFFRDFAGEAYVVESVHEALLALNRKVASWSDR
jgi:hypothetical protein